MASPPVTNPEIPYVGEVEGGLSPGKLVNIRGSVPEGAVRFAINYQLGPNLNPRDDIAIHLSPRFNDGIITRNHIRSMSWGPEENGGSMWLQPGQNFEIIILCEPLQYKIAINGRHYTEFAHRLSYQSVTHLVIDGDVEISSIHYESINSAPGPQPGSLPVDVPPASFGPPSAGGLYPTIGPQVPPGANNYPPGNYGYNPPPGTHVYKPEKSEEEDVFGGCLDKVGLAVGGLIAAGGVAAAMHAMNKKKDPEEDHEKTDSSKLEGGMGLAGLGALGAALASSLAQGDSRSSPGYPPQDSGPGGMLGSILGSLGGGASELPGFPSNKHGGSDSLGDLGGLGSLGSILGGVLGKGGHQQPAYEPSGGYSRPQSDDPTSNLISGIGGALFNSALDSLTKHKSHGPDHPPSYPQHPPPPQYEQSYGARDGPPSAPPHYQPRATTPPSSGNDKLSAADISKGLGLGDDDD